MRSDRATSPGPQAPWPPPHDGPARCGGRNPMHRRDHLPMEPAAARLPSLCHGPAPFLQLCKTAACRVPSITTWRWWRGSWKGGSSPSAGVIDSQCVKITGSDGPCGFDVGKLIKGRTRHAAADTLGLMVGAVVRPVGVPDRDGAPMAPRLTSKSWPWLRHIFAEGGYAGPKLPRRPEGRGRLAHRDHQAAGRHPRFRGSAAPVGDRADVCLAKDRDASVSSTQAWLLIAHIGISIRHLARFRAGPIELCIGL